MQSFREDERPKPSYKQGLVSSVTKLATCQARAVAGLVDLLLRAPVFGYADSGDRLASAGRSAGFRSNISTSFERQAQYYRTAGTKQQFRCAGRNRMSSGYTEDRKPD
jgi:hypothetical protein